MHIVYNYNVSIYILKISCHSKARIPNLETNEQYFEQFIKKRLISDSTFKIIVKSFKYIL